MTIYALTDQVKYLGFGRLPKCDIHSKAITTISGSLYLPRFALNELIQWHEFWVEYAD